MLTLASVYAFSKYASSGEPLIHEPHRYLELFYALGYLKTVSHATKDVITIQQILVQLNFPCFNCMC